MECFMASKKETIPLTYKGRPLRRKDNLIFGYDESGHAATMNYNGTTY